MDGEGTGPEIADKDERIRLLEYQIAFLRRELTLVTKRYEGVVYSAAWTVARPIKTIEDLLHRGAARFRRSKASFVAVPPETPLRPSRESLADEIATRISHRMTQPPDSR